MDYSSNSQQQITTPGGSVFRRIKSSTNKGSSGFGFDTDVDGGIPSHHLSSPLSSSGSLGNSYSSSSSYNNNNNTYYHKSNKVKGKGFNRGIAAFVTILMVTMCVFCFQTTITLFGNSSPKHSISKANLNDFRKKIYSQNVLYVGDEQEEKIIPAVDVANKKMTNNEETGAVDRDIQHSIRHAGVARGVYRSPRRSQTNPKKKSMLASVLSSGTVSGAPLSQEDLDRIADSANQLKGYINPSKKAKEDYSLQKAYGITNKVSNVKTIAEIDGMEFDEEDHFGNSMAVLGDINKDGFMDIAVGTPGANAFTGAIHILSVDREGNVQNSRYITPQSNMDQFNVWGEMDSIGYAVENVGDLDGDGINDMAVSGISFPSGENIGEVIILFLQEDFKVKKHVKITSRLNGFDFTLKANSHFGSSIANIGDVDGDGVQDLLVGAVGLSQYRGGMFLLNMNRDGTVKSQLQISSSHNMDLKLQPDDEFGASLKAIGDLDGDGIQEVVVGADSYPNGEAMGSSFICWFDSNGTVKKVRRIDELDGELDGEDYFGTAFAVINDLNGDGIKEIAVSAHGQVDYEGCFYILFLNKDGTVKEYTRISTDEGLPINLDFEDEFGKAMISLDDFSQDGKVSLMVSALGYGGEERHGVVYFLQLEKE